MTRFTAWAVFSLIFLPFVLFSQPQQFSYSDRPSDLGFSMSRLDLLDGWLDKMVKEGTIPNAVTFVAKRGKIIHYKAFGFRNREQAIPLEKDDIFRIASQTKAITTVAALMLHEEGKFLLTDPVSKYIPYFANPKVLVRFDSASGTVETRPAKREITIKDLLTHTAGIPYQHPMDHIEEYKVPFFNSLEPDRLTTIIPKIAARPLLHDPGEQFTYGLNTDIVGYLVEVLSGMPLDQFFRTRIFEPIGMKDSHFYLPMEKAPRLVELYAKPAADSMLAVSDHFNNRYFPVQGAKTYYSGGAGLVSTIEDYARFCQMLLNGGEFNGKQLLSPKSVDLLFRNQIGDLRVWERNDGFSLGFEVFSEQTNYGDLASPGSIMWGGMYCSEYTIDPKENLILLVFTNVHPFAQGGEFLRRYRNLVYQSLIK
ncbi:MAG: beta-lactamase family protein [Haliscomenobacter sp.]|nr:beta-lactamase family protein [Haliscomenobacter sp.]MBK8877710.1 beta-lactamase family protein [Haliscomenobacter sp.]